MVNYTIKFNLTAPTSNFEKAKEYLGRVDYANLFNSYHNDPALKDTQDKISSIKWVLTSESEGYINIELKSIPNEQDIEYINRYVFGQSCDGLGEGYEQLPYSNRGVIICDISTNK